MNAHMSVAPAIPCCFAGAFGLLGLIATIFWIWMLVDCAVNETSEGNTKVVWILIIIFTHGLGGLIYFLVRRPQRKTELGR